MSTANLSNHRKEVVEAAAQIVATGIMTKSLHGNVSMRVPGEDAFLLTAGGSLANMQPENIALFKLDGTLIEGTVAPVGAEIIQMHGIVYRKRADVQSVVHTHSPFATGFAVAGKAIPGAYEALVRNGMVDGVPLAKYGPRGSDESVNNIAAVLDEFESAGLKGLLLENHGVLVFADSLGGAVRANVTVEEAAEICLYAYSLGGPKEIPAHMIKATRERAAEFAAAGSFTAESPRN
jgi:L-ribulose-5-phosphate 4-epimerase